MVKAHHFGYFLPCKYKPTLGNGIPKIIFMLMAFAIVYQMHQLPPKAEI